MTIENPPAGRAGGVRWLLVCTAAAILAIALAGEYGRLALRYDAAAVGAGQWWRLLTGHLTHLGWSHALLNLTGLGLAALLFGGDYRVGQWLAIAALALVAIDATFLMLRPDLAWYVGLSGVLHGLFAAGALRWIVRGELEGYLLAAFLTAKLAWEQVFGALPLSVSGAGGPVVVDAHLAGALGGAAGAVAVVLHDWYRSRR